jgi:lipopolysaccharide/colanic/teichoic acid biosynthesis glycosyltransferase
MSLVGPRPVVKKELEEYGKLKNKFLSVKPGVTGLWQVSGRSEIQYPERCYIELEYIDIKSLKIDLKIIIKTIFSVFSKKGAF